MTCADLPEMLALEPEEGLPSGARSHLEACAECRKIREDLAALRGLAATPEASAPAPPAAILPSRVTRWDWLNVGLSAAAGFLLVLSLLPAPVLRPEMLRRPDPERLRALLRATPAGDRIPWEIPTSMPDVSITVSYKPFAKGESP